MTTRFITLDALLRISTHILTRRMTITTDGYVRDGPFQLTSSQGGWPARSAQLLLPAHFNSHPHKEDDMSGSVFHLWLVISTHILTRRMTAILNKIFSFKIKLYIHYNILFAIFYIYNSILYPFSSPKRSYSGANDSANYCSLAFRTPRFPIPSLQIHFS